MSNEYDLKFWMRVICLHFIASFARFISYSMHFVVIDFYEDDFQ